MAEKRYFWIKLMDDFLWGDKVKFLMHQKNGAEYVVMYEMLCSLAKNSNGRLVKQLGNILIELDIDAIYGELKGYFEYDTIVVAMSLFAKLDLVYKEDESGIFTIKDFKSMIGSEGANAARMRRLRENARQNQLHAPSQSDEYDVTQMSQSDDVPSQSDEISVTRASHTPSQSVSHCDYRDKSLEYRVKSIDNSLSDSNSAQARVCEKDEELDFYKTNLHERIDEIFPQGQDANKFHNYTDMVADARIININGMPHRAAEVLSILAYYCTTLNRDEFYKMLSFSEQKISQGDVANEFNYTVAALYNNARNHGAKTIARRI